MDPYHMNPTPSSRAEADRWLAIAEKLLANRDLVGSKTFAIRARESEPRLEAADQILALADTLISGDKRINGTLPDWYAVLQLPPLTSDLDLVAAHYRGLAILLNPNRSRLCFADQAFRLVSDAWSVLSNPSRKQVYDSQIVPPRVDNDVNVNVYLGGDPVVHQNPRLDDHVVDIGLANNNNNNNNYSVQHNPRLGDDDVDISLNNNDAQQNPRFESSVKITTNNDGNSESNPRNEDGFGLNAGDGDVGETFWTACPYCYNMYEYPLAYEECTMRCQNCRRAFHGAKVPSPPIEGGDTYATWGFYPLGVSMSMMEKNKGGVANWTPFSPMFAFNKGDGVVEEDEKKKKKKERRAGPVVYIEDDGNDDDDDVFFDGSDTSEESDEEWGSTRTKKSGRRRGRGRKRGRGRTHVRSNNNNNNNMNNNNNNNNDNNMERGVVDEVAPKEVVNVGKKQVGKAMKERGKLDLNVEFNNEGEEQPMRGGAARVAHGEEDGGEIEGIGFFEGLDEFLSSLPILNVVGDDKVKAA